MESLGAPTNFTDAANQLLSPQVSLGSAADDKAAKPGEDGLRFDSSSMVLVRQLSSLKVDDYDLVTEKEVLHQHSPFGEIVFRFKYEPLRETLQVVVMKAVAIRHLEGSNNLPNTFVKVLLYEPRARHSDSFVETHCVPASCNPVFNTCCEFPNYSCPWLMKAKMKLKVVHRPSSVLHSKLTLGEVVIKLGSKQYNLLDETPLTLPLQSPRRR